MATSEVSLGGNPPLRPYLIAHAMAVIAMIAGLLIEGRVFFCGCGSWVPWTIDVNSEHCSQHMFDAYTSSHVLHGVVFFGAFWLLRTKISGAWRLWGCLVVEAMWEVLENSAFVIDRYRTGTMALGYEGDSITNSLCDLASCMGGYLIANQLPWKWSVAFFLAVELVLLLLIRDSLVLNVVMLVYPLDVIKQWQMGGWQDR